MIPYFEQPVLHLGPLAIHAFGVAAAAAVGFGLAAAQRRFARLGLDPEVGDRLAWWILIGAAIGAHLFSVLFYFPEKLRDDPWLLVRLWEDISSFGGMLGGLAGAMLYFATHGRAISGQAVAYLDAVAFVFPASLAVGRLGCALAHDHPGAITSFPLAISAVTPAARSFIARVYESAGRELPAAAGAMGFHDLGLYELLYLALVVVPLFMLWNRRRRPAGFYLTAFAVLYLPIRFLLDMLRVADARYIGLTPAQWVAALTVAALPFVLVRRREVRLALAAIVVLATAWACKAGGP